MVRWFVVLLLLATPAVAQEAHDVAHLRAALAGPQSATQILTRWCGDLHLASPPVIKAVRSAENKPPSAETRRLLQAEPGETIRYRQVALTCGSHVLSEADNWYRPGQLSAAMNHQLDSSDTSFGTVVRPLNFTRRSLEMRARAGAGTVLEVKALLISGAGVPFSLVVEDYQRDLLVPR